MKSKIVIVGDFWSRDDAIDKTAFTGYQGAMLRSMLNMAGIDPTDCHFTNVFNMRGTGDLEGFAGSQTEAIPNYPKLLRKFYIRNNFAGELERLHAEIEDQDPNLVIALGAVPMWALTKQDSIQKYRGTPMHNIAQDRKVLCTYHPKTLLKQYAFRPITLADFGKAAQECEFREIIRPKRYIWIEPSLDDLDTFYEEYIRGVADVSADIETKLRTITEVGFAPREDVAIVVPFWDREKESGNYWNSVEEEVQAWRWVAKVLYNHAAVGQNFLYDLQYLWRTMRIPVPVVADDTMLMHHSMQPEMQKSLGFLGSIYTNEPSWKFMRTDHSTLKDED